MKEMIVAILFGFAVFSLVLSIRFFCGKGFLLNNAYLYASKEEREAMNKKPHYRQSGIVFLLIGTIFAVNALNTVFQKNWLFFCVIGIVAVTIIYAIASSVLIEKRKNRK